MRELPPCTLHPTTSMPLRDVSKGGNYTGCLKSECVAIYNAIKWSLGDSMTHPMDCNAWESNKMCNTRQGCGDNGGEEIVRQ